MSPVHYQSKTHTCVLKPGVSCSGCLSCAHVRSLCFLSAICFSKKEFRVGFLGHTQGQERPGAVIGCVPAPQEALPHPSSSLPNIHLSLSFSLSPFHFTFFISTCLPCTWITFTAGKLTCAYYIIIPALSPLPSSPFNPFSPHPIDKALVLFLSSHFVNH